MRRSIPPATSYHPSAASRVLDTPEAARLRRRYCHHLCLFFASAVARASGLGVGTLVAADLGNSLGHAVLLVSADGEARDGWRVADALGPHRLGDVRSHFEALGGAPLTYGPRRPRARDPATVEPDRAILAIAGCLPWLAEHIDPAWAASGRVARDRVREVLDAVEDAAAGAGRPDWSGVERVLDALGAPGVDEGSRRRGRGAGRHRGPQVRAGAAG